MSRHLNTAAVQLDDSDKIVVELDLKDFRCLITFQIIFDPVMTHCGQHIERAASADRLPGCPCCGKASHNQFSEASAFYKATLQRVIQENNLYQDVFFDLQGFKRIVAENKLATPIGERFLTLLQNAPRHLNDKELIRTETQTTHPAYLEIPEYTVTTSYGKSAIEILAETPTGRDLLRKKLRIDASSGQFFFGHAEISAESLQMQVNGKTIREWLSITTDMELMLAEEQKARETISLEETIAAYHLQTGLFLQRRRAGRSAVATAEGDLEYSDAVSPILQHVVYGEEGKVRDALESVKSNPTQLAALLFDTGTVTDYSNRTITGMTLLQAAAAAGDIDMCLLLKNYYIAPEEFAWQLTEIFPKGIEAHDAEQQHTAFNFNTILAAIRAASPPDLDAARNKQNNDSLLCLALEAFRDEFTGISSSEKIFNLHHLLKAFEVYNAFWDQCDANSTIDPDYKKRNLFWCQIIGFCQRFMPACYAQAFSQGLCYLVKTDQNALWCPEAFKRDLKLSFDNFSYFPLPASSRSGLGLGFDFAIYARAGGRRSTGRRAWRDAALFFQKLLSRKNSWLSEHYAASAGAVTDDRLGFYSRIQCK